jgi:multidrug efflux pump subunit AcrA (membrane-fusion protein)
VVLTRTAQRGEVVQPGRAIITIADMASPLILRLPVADRDVARVAMGSSAAVRADALGALEIAGRVTRIGQQAGAQSGAIEIEVTLPPASGLRSGMVATALIGAAPSAVGEAFARVPAEAILEANGSRAFVMLYDAASGTARRTEVRFGGFDGDDALVSGLRDGVRVITGGAGYVANGARVAVSAAIKP